MGTPDTTATDTSEKDLTILVKREKDTRAAYTKGQQKIKALEAENATLASQVNTSLSLSAEQAEELEDLKYSDPDAWRKQLNEYEAENTKMNNKKVEEAQQKANYEFELTNRGQLLEEFNKTLEVPITDETIQNDVPPRITAKLESGDITFEEFLNEVTTYLGKGKVVANPNTLDQPNIGHTGGGHTAESSGAAESFNDSYEETTW